MSFFMVLAVTAVAVLVLLGPFLVVVVIGPISTLIYLGVEESVDLIQPRIDADQPGAIRSWLDDAAPSRDQIPESLRWLLPADSSPIELAGEQLRRSAVEVFSRVGRNLLGWVEDSVQGLLSVLIYLFGVQVLFVRGRRC
jgi:predicted PurR-regulated permease PerM